MKISIIGPSGSGKTYLTNKLSDKYKLKHINLDYIFFKHVQDKNREAIQETVWRKNLKQVISENDWIIEGVNPINEIFDNADLIIFLRPILLVALSRQWKRYFTDAKQRKEHGFVNNLKLSRGLIKQYAEKEDLRKQNDPMYSRVSKLDRLMSRYKKKVRILRNKKEVSNFLDEKVLL